MLLTFECVDEITWCDYSNETSSAVLSHGTITIEVFYKMKFVLNFDFRHSWELKGSINIFLLETVVECLLPKNLKIPVCMTVDFGAKCTCFWSSKNLAHMVTSLRVH